MGSRVAGIWLNPRSKNYWFRMGVPERHRARVGKREFKWSLDTTNIEVARDRHASKLGEVRALIARLDAEALASVGDEADTILGRGIATLARGNLNKNDDGVPGLIEAEDNVARGMLLFLAYRTRLTWGPDHADLVELELFGEIPEEVDNITFTPLGFIDPKDQDAVVTRVKSMESDPRYLGFANRDIARVLLARQSWMAAEYEVLLVASAAGIQVKPRTPLFDALAERVLRYLAERRFQHWPAHIDDLFTPMAIAISAAPAEATPPTPETDVHRLSDALSLWRARRGLGLVFILLEGVGVWWTFRENSFAAPVVKLQQGQRTIDTGPYAVVRHPMYASAVLLFLGVPLLLGSWLGLAFAIIFIFAVAWRAVHEEKALRAELDGYEDYMRRLRYRLVPFIW